jgi:MATE family multidrug resistance protein
MHMAWPIGVSMISFTLKGFIDMLLVGRLGIEELGAVGLASVMAWNIIAFPMGMLRGQRPLVSQYMGAGDRMGAFSYGVHAFYLAMVWGAVCFLISEPAAAWVIEITASDQMSLASRGYARDYLETRIAWAGTTLLAIAVAEYLRSTSRPRIGMAADLLAHPTNIALSWVLIFGLFGMPELGVRGAAVGTGLSDLLALVVMLYLVRPRKPIPREAIVYRWRRMKRVLSTGVTAGVQFSIESGAFAIITVMIGSLGTTALAVHQAAIQLVHLSIMPAIAVGDGGSTLVGRFMGEKQFEHVERALRSTVKITSIFMAAMGVVYLAFGRELISIFFQVGDPDYEAALSLGAKVMIAAAIWQVADSYQVSYRFCLRAAGDHHFVMYTCIVCSWALSVPLAWVVVEVLEGDLADVWMAWNLEIFLGSLLFWWRWRSGAWRSKRMVEDEPVVDETVHAEAAVDEPKRR